ncbi:hypothetical protein BB560_001206 [Smittium megazygosporum]|uniref:Uncharacterized protein n=1 Tax=Smittium megazygosporum TaxID=133381 RepID=A0A2T9ZI93_9FUNG|nr:hypothetical protein BB560_001206 [Smittium megazygosporum]
MHRIRQEMGVTTINTRASDLRERAYFKYPSLRTWISDLVKQPIRSQTSTWVTGTARWMKRYCQTVRRGNTVKALQHRYTVNDKTKISAWIKAHNMRNTECFRWNSIRHETTIFNIPRVYRTATIDQSTDNQALNQGRNIMVGKLLGGSLKKPGRYLHRVGTATRHT